MDNKAYFIDASPSWNGFSYQGKVALFTFMKYSVTTLAIDLKLELEWLEDFSIINDGKYQSIHQVKALKSTQLSGYTDAICDLAKKLMGFIPEVVFERFFLGEKKVKKEELVKELKDFLKKQSIIDENSLIINSDLELINNLKFQNKDQKKVELHIKNTLIFYTKLKSNLKYIKAYLHTIRRINFDKNTLLKQNKIVALRAEKLVPFNDFDEILDRILPYQDYEIIVDCCSKKINELNVKFIDEKFIALKNGYKGFGNKELAEKIYAHIRLLFDEHISQRHLDIIYNVNNININGIKEVEKIKWSDISEILRTSEDKLDEPTNKKKAFVLKEKFEAQFQKEAQRLYRNSQDVKIRDEKIRKMRLRMEYIFKEHPREIFLEFCKNISPRRDTKQFKLRETIEVLDPSDGVKNPYFKFFGEVYNDLGDGENHKFKLKDKFYLPTIIRHDEGFEVAYDIVNNDNAPDTVFETDYLINKVLKGHTIREYLHDLTDINNEEESDEELEEYRITNMKNVEFIDIDTAINHFNND